MNKNKKLIWIVIIGGGLLYGLGMFIYTGLSYGFSWSSTIGCFIGGVIISTTCCVGELIGEKIIENKKKKLKSNQSIALPTPKDLFIPCRQRTGSYYFEFQYCKKVGAIKELTNKGYVYWSEDSILVHVNYMEEFLDEYGTYLREANLPNGTNQFDEYSVNYYTKEQTQNIIERISEDKPKDYEIIVAWLKKAVNEYNGFYFIGI